MELTENKKQNIEQEYEKLKEVINYVQQISHVDNDANTEVRRFIVLAGISIYNKL